MFMMREAHDVTEVRSSSVLNKQIRRTESALDTIMCGIPEADSAILVDDKYKESELSMWEISIGVLSRKFPKMGIIKRDNDSSLA